MPGAVGVEGDILVQVVNYPCKLVLAAWAGQQVGHNAWLPDLLKSGAAAPSRTFTDDKVVKSETFLPFFSWSGKKTSNLREFRYGIYIYICY